MRFLSIFFAIIIFLNLSVINLFSDVKVEESLDGVRIRILNNSLNVDSINEHKFVNLKYLEKFKIFDESKNVNYIFNIAIPNGLYDLKFEIINENEILSTSYNNYEFPSEYFDKKQNIGKSRGISILSVPFSLFRLDKISNKLFFANEIQIVVKFKNYKFDKFFKNINLENSLFKDIINQNQLQTLIFLRNQTKRNEINNELLANNWYNPNFNYVKIQTEKDGITAIVLGDVLNYLPEIKSKSSKNLHLIHNGKPYPYIILNDSDGLISEIDTLVFYGKRPSGDTTWFDNYTNVEPFYIYFDESLLGLKFSEMGIIDPNNLETVTSVDIFKHIEEEKFYGIGTEFITTLFDGSLQYSNYNDSRTVQSEGWYWDQIFPRGFGNVFNKDIFQTSIHLVPSDNSNDSLTVSVRYLTNQDSITREPVKVNVPTYFDLYFSTNERLIKRDSLRGYHKKDFKAAGNVNMFLPGINKFKIESKQIYVETNERTNIDYIEIQGKSKPVALNDELSFKGKQKDIKIDASGFTSKNLIAFDIYNNKFKNFYNSRRGFQFNLGGISGESSYVTIGIADSIEYFTQSGIYVLYYDISKKSYFANNFQSNFSELGNYLNAIPNGCPIAIVVNINQQSFDLSHIKNIGSKIIDNYKSGNVYVGAYLKSGNKIEEKIGTNFAALSIFLENESGINYNFNIELKSDLNSYFYLIGQNSININKNITPVNKTNLNSRTDKVDAIFVSHKNFINKTNKLAEYRSTNQNIKIEVVDVEDIYKEYNFGKKSPHAIKSFIKYCVENRGLTYATLIGDASWDARRKLDRSISTDYIPTYGYPASDWWYTCLDGDDDFRADLILGRIPVNNENQLQNYIDKIKDYDTLSALPWMKNFLFLIGGYDSREINSFHSLITSHYRDEILYPGLCGTIDKVVKNSTNSSTSSQGGEIREKINKGALWTIYIGHAAAEVFDLDGWSVNSLNNKGRYGILSTVSCNTGAFAEPELIASRNEQYILEKDKGFVAATGATFTGFVGEHNTIATRMVEAVADESMGMRRIGDLMFYGKANLSRISIPQMITVNTFSLLGDPLLNVRVGTEPDAYIRENDVTIKNQDGIERFTTDDSYILISAEVFNYGYAIQGDIPVKIIREYNNNSEVKYLTLYGLCYSNNLAMDFSIYDMPGRHKITIIIDPDNTFSELTKSNNIIVKNIDVLNSGLLALDPQPYWDVNSISPRFRFINPFAETDEYDYDFLISNSTDTNNVILSASSAKDSKYIQANSNFVDWSTEINLPDGSFWIHARFKNKTTNILSSWISFPFNANENYFSSKVNAKIKSKDEINNGEIVNLKLLNDNNTNKLFLRRDTLSFKSLSVKGNLPGNPDGNPVVQSRVNIEVGNKVFVDGPHDLGFNVITIKNESGNFVTRQRRFETWGLGIKYPAQEHFSDSLTPLRLVEFLRDSVQDDEYLIVATCQSSFRLPLLYKLYGEPGNHGSVDSLLYYLKQFGSKIADTLKIDEENNGEQISFTMMGWRGAEIGSIPENISFVGDSALISGNLTTFIDSGKYISPIIQRAKKWNSLKIDGVYFPNNTEVTALVKSVNNNTNLIDTLIRQTFPTEIDLNHIDPKVYSSLSIDLNYKELQKSNNNLVNSPSSYIKSFEFDFIPIDELAIDKESTILDKESSLRGVPVNLRSEILNLSLRNKLDSAIISLNISKSGIDDDYRNVIIRNFNPSSTYTLDYPIITDFLDVNNTVFLNLNPNETIDEYYLFNNKFNLPLNTIKDTIKPRIVLKIDDKIHQKNDFISMLPYFEVELYDNSPLLITDSTKITVRVNGYLHPYQRTLWSKFETINDGTNLKARFSFRPDSMQYEDVSIIVYFSDNEGNRDTLITEARVSLINAFVEDQKTYPNPMKDDMNFSFLYKAPVPGGLASIEIFDLSGNKIDEISKQLLLGINTILWNGKYNSNQSLPSGLYIYRIRVKSEFYIEPVYGKFLKVN